MATSSTARNARNSGPGDSSPNPHSYDVSLLDHAFVTPAAGRRLLTYLSDMGTMVDRAIWGGSPNDPLLAPLPQECRRVLIAHYWMMRILDVEKALTARGYPAGVTAELHFQVADELLERNRGRFVLTVTNAQGRVRRGGHGHLQLDIRGLAPLYSSLYSAEHLALTGLLDGKPEHLALASAAFAGPLPWMNDRF